MFFNIYFHIIHKEKALEILNTEIGSKLTGERIMLDKYTEITECDNNVILYDDRRW